MKGIQKIILVIVISIALLFAITTYIIKDPKADFIKESLNINEYISLSEIRTENSKSGSFKSSLKIKQQKVGSSSKEFYGQEILISNNPQIDRILVGITNNLISRLEIWNRNELIQFNELGFINKMKQGESHTMSIEFYDQTNERYRGNSKISMRFYGGTGFFGDIGTINVDLTKFGDLSGNKLIGVFAKSLTADYSDPPKFTDFKIWKNFRSFD